MSKSTPRQTFGSESASAGKANETNAPKYQHLVENHDLPEAPHAFHGEIPPIPTPIRQG